MQAEIQLTLKLQQRLFADPRRIKLLKQVKATGSISQGAKLAKISYKNAWDTIDSMNQLAGKTLVERSTGGKGGGGAQLTTYADRLIQLYDLLEKIQQKAFDTLQDESFPLDSLLTAISRISLQTSARNQFLGTLVERSHQSVQQYIDVLLADGQTHIRAAITQQSADRLQLSPGKEVFVLIKAPWVTICRHANENDNILAGNVLSIQSGSSNSEVHLKLQGGEMLCATLANTELARLELKTAQPVFACFNADKVIIATLC